MDRRLLVLAVGMFAVGTDNFVIAGILPSISMSLNTSASAAGQMVSIYALSFAILAPVIAALAGGWSRKFLLMSALGIFVVGNALSAVATDLNTVLVSRALAGLGAAMFAPTALGAAASLVAHEKGGAPLQSSQRDLPVQPHWERRSARLSEAWAGGVAHSGPSLGLA
ncbi:MFS transporter [Bradyrhizobium sp. Leo170]|uniref:MFS transporter n=1 Tax=Bradyrhizobium sp. Leo170 TaxID=1571199 RepID=UPI001A91ADD7|nr:MFS transporter [Bradyrhizobium sp. Leo170]